MSWRVINARHWLPQFRERVYIVGLRSDLGCLPMDWEAVLSARREASSSPTPTIRSILEDRNSASVALSELTAEQWASVVCQVKGRDPRDVRRIDLDSKAPTLVSGYHTSSSHSTKFIFEEAGEILLGDDAGPNPKRPRFLTPRECARCMGFPDSFPILDELGEHGRGRFYRQIGNAVCPPVIRAISEHLLGLIKSK